MEIKEQSSNFKVYINIHTEWYWISYYCRHNKIYYKNGRRGDEVWDHGSGSGRWDGNHLWKENVINFIFF